MAAGSKQLAANGKAAKRAAAEGPATWLPRFQAYLEELKREMRLVTWPSRSQVRSTTLVVLVTVFAFAVFFGVVDFLLASGQTWLYQSTR